MDQLAFDHSIQLSRKGYGYLVAVGLERHNLLHSFELLRQEYRYLYVSRFLWLQHRYEASHDLLGNHLRRYRYFFRINHRRPVY